MRRHQLWVSTLIGLLLTTPAWAAGPKSKATPVPIPSEMPSFGKERTRFGDMFMQKKQWKQAEQEYRSATLIDPRYFPAAVGLADALYMLKNYRESMEAYQKALRLVRPTYAAVPYQQAAKLSGQNQVLKALVLYRRVAHIKPEAGAMLNKGLGALDAGDKAGAKKAFLEAIRLDADYADAHYKIGNLSYDAKDFVSAIDAYEKAAKAESGDGLILFKLGNAYYHFQSVVPKGDKYAFYRAWDRKSRDAKWSQYCMTKAVAAYRLADRLQPGDFDILYNLGKTELTLGLYANAAKALEQAVKLQNDDADAHTALGNAYFKMATKLPGYNNAIRHYRVALQLDPTRWDMEYNIGQAYYMKSKIRPDADQFEITPAKAQFYYAKGAEFHKTDMLEQALEHFGRFLSNAKGSPKYAAVQKLVSDIGKETSRSVQGGHH